MNIKHISLFQYALELVMPLSIKGNDLKKREGLIISIQSDTGHIGYGEIAPLEGFSKETLNDAKAQAIPLATNLVGFEISPKFVKLDGAFENWMGDFGLLSSVRCGIEMAILNLFAIASDEPLHHIISNEYHEKIRLNGLLQGTREEVKHHATALLEQGFTSLKLKVGGDLKEDIAKVQIVNDIISGKALLHLDVNQAWTINQAIEFIDAVGLATVDYIEEPFQKLESISTFSHQTTVPVALDETLLEKDFNDIKSIEGVDIIILKPTILGGFEKSYQIAKEANRLAIDTVISSTFESGIGIEALAHLSGCTARDRTAGLDTLKWYKNDLLKKPLVINRGKMEINRKALTMDEIDFDHLEEIPI